MPIQTTTKQLSSQLYSKHLIKVLIVICVFSICCLSAPQDDKIAGIPGYPSDFNASVYSGYLKTSSDSRKLHYVFIQNYKGAKNVLPVLLWMNGGPGCASKIGLIQEIAPYLLPLNASYQSGDDLKANQYTWLNIANLLFIDNPAGVGFSVNKDPDYVYNDKNTAQDTMDSLVDFFVNKFPQYLTNPFYIAGQSYAGKYIPDLTLQIYNYNSMTKDKQINIKGILLGNPIITVKGGSLEDSQIQFMMNHHFVDPKIYPHWKGACHSDPLSAGCQFFYARYEQLLKRIDFYNIYGPCLDGQTHLSQASFTKMMAKNYSRLTMTNDFPWKWTQFSQCSNDKPVNDYFSINAKAFNSEVSNFSVCNSKIYQTYDISEGGSLTQLQSLIGIGQIKVFFFSGDFDDVVPFTDTVKNLERMGLRPDGMQTPMKIGLQHVGFIRSFKDKKNVKFFIIKGAGHEAVAYQPATAYKMLQIFLTPAS